MMRKMVLFGAGKIGRSFVGQLFSCAGYEIVFIDTDRKLVDRLNSIGAYKVVVKEEGAETEIFVRNVRAIHASEDARIVQEVASASILGISVGKNGLPNVLPIIASGITERYSASPSLPLDIIIAENMRNSDAYFRSYLRPLLPEDYPIDSLLGLVETSIGKMVPTMLEKDLKEDPLQLFAENYNTLILNADAFKNPIPRVKGLAPKKHMKAWVDRKIFIHNLGHAVSAYTGYALFPEKNYIHEVLRDAEVLKITRVSMKQASRVLLLKYPESFSEQDLDRHIEDLLRRFRNKALRDTVYRIGCDLPRKLAPDDRLIGALRSAMDLGLPYDKILFGVVCAFRFRACDEHGDRLPQDIHIHELYHEGIDQILQEVCGFHPVKDAGIFKEATKMDQEINQIVHMNSTV